MILKKNNIYLESDGPQHFKPVSVFGGQDSFQKQQDRDFEKDKFSIENKLKLIRIYSKEIKAEYLNLIFNSSTTIEILDNIFSNILVIDDGKIQLVKGKYKKFKIVEYIQANGNKS